MKSICGCCNISLSYNETNRLSMIGTHLFPFCSPAIHLGPVLTTLRHLQPGQTRDCSSFTSLMLPSFSTRNVHLPISSCFILFLLHVQLQALSFSAMRLHAAASTLASTSTVSKYCRFRRCLSGGGGVYCLSNDEN